MTTAIENALTRDHLKALRNADSAVFRFELGEDTGTISLSKEIERGDGFGRDKLHVEIPALALVNNYGSDYGGEHSLQPAISGCWVLLYTLHHPVWQTMVRFLRTGDALVQEWVVDNRNTLLKEARLTAHELKIRVHRPAKDGRTAVHTFMLDACVRNPYNLGDEVRRGTPPQRETT